MDAHAEIEVRQRDPRQGDSSSLVHGDTSQALEFLRHWSPKGQWLLAAIAPETREIEVRTFSPNREAYAAAWITEWQGERNLYFSVNQPTQVLSRKAKKADIGWATALHVDADPRNGFDLASERVRILAALRAHEPRPTVIVDTGGGYSAFWCLREPIPANDPDAVEARNLHLAATLGGDHCHNVDRIMRLPGTVNLPDEGKRRKGRMPALAHVVEADWSRRYDLTDIEAVTAQAKGTAPVAGPQDDRPGDLAELPPELRGLVVTGDAAPWQGDRSRAVWHAACSLARAGWSEAQIATALLDTRHGISAHVHAQGDPHPYAERQARRALEEVAKEPPVLNPDEPRGSARAFVARRRRPLACHAGDLYEWRDSHYRALDDSDVRADLYAFLDAAKRQGRKKLEPFAPNRSKVDNVLDALKALVHLPSELTPPCWVAAGDAETGPIMACRNGLLRLSDGALLPHSPSYFATAAADFDYDPAAPEPEEWLKFLASLWPTDQQAINTLQETFGYVLSGDNRHQKMFLLIGPPRCGKGTIGRILVKLLGGRGHVGLPLGSLNGDFGLQPLIGKMLAIVPDARLHGRSHTITERLLAISGGDDLTVARKNTTSVTMRLPARFVFLTNVLPSLADPSGTIASRFIVQMLSVSFLGNEDLDLERRLNKRGRFIQPASGKESAVNLSYLASPMRQFIEETYVMGGNGEERTDDVYNEWCSWWVNSGQSGEPGNKTSFGVQLAAAFPHVRKEERRRMVRGVSTKWYVYVGLSRQGREGGLAAQQAEQAAYEDDAVPF